MAKTLNKVCSLITALLVILSCVNINFCVYAVNGTNNFNTLFFDNFDTYTDTSLKTVWKSNLTQNISITDGLSGSALKISPSPSANVNASVDFTPFSETGEISVSMVAKFSAGWRIAANLTNGTIKDLISFRSGFGSLYYYDNNGDIQRSTVNYSGYQSAWQRIKITFNTNSKTATVSSGADSYTYACDIASINFKGLTLTCERAYSNNVLCIDDICIAKNNSQNVVADIDFTNGYVKSNGAYADTAAEFNDDGIYLKSFSENAQDSSYYDIVPRKGNILVNADADLVNLKPYENVNFVIEYKDNDYGWFFIRYNTADGEKTTDYVNLTGTGESKTHTVTLNDIVFDNAVRGYDFEICTTSYTWNAKCPARYRAWSKYGITLKSITVEKTGVTSPVDAKVSSQNTGNIFYGNEICKLDINYTNKSNDNLNLTALYNIYKYNTDDTKTLINTDSQKIYVGSKSQSDYSIVYTPDEYGLYGLEIVLKDNLNVERGIFYSDFSKCAENTALNKHVGVSTHMNRDGNAKECIDITQKGGLGLVRESVYWRDYEKSPGVYKLNDEVKDVFEQLSSTDLENVMILYANNPIYDTQAEADSFPSENTVKHFKDYVTAVLNEPLIKNNPNTHMVEVWNEPDIMKYWNTADISASDEQKAKAYANVLKAAYDAAKEAGDYKVGAFCVCNLWGAPGTTFIDYVLNELGGKQCFDNLTLHPYSGVTSDVEIGSNGADRTDPRCSQAYLINRIKTLITGGKLYNYVTGTSSISKGEATGNTYSYSLNDSVWHTEYGISSAIPYGGMSTGSDYLQAQIIIRGLNNIRKNNINDKIWIYDLVCDGTQPNEEQHNYGIVNAAESNTPYSAKYAYLAVANYNRLTQNASAIKQIKGDKASDGYRFLTKYTVDGGNVYLLYTTKQSARLYYNLGDNVTYYDLFGNKLSQDDVMQNGEYILTNTPFYAVQNNNVPEPSQIGVSISITDGIKVLDGKAIENINFLTANASITGLDGTPESTKVYIAVYKNKKLAAVKSYKKTDGTGDTLKQFKLNFAYGRDIDDIKIFVWNMPKAVPIQMYSHFERR